MRMGPFDDARNVLGRAGVTGVVGEPVADREQMPAIAERLLADEVERTALAQAARELATQFATRKRSVSMLLEAIEEARR